MNRSQVYVARQPVLDSHLNLFAYELRFHIGVSPNGHTLLDTEKWIDKIEEDIGFQTIVGSYPCMLHMPAKLLNPASIPTFESDHLVILELESSILKDVAVLHQLKALKMQGYHFLLDDYRDDEACDRLSTIAGYAKIKVSDFETPELEAMVKKLHGKGIKVIADSVQSQEAFDALVPVGFDYFHGYFFTNPTVVNGQKLSGNKLNLLQLMAKVNAPQTGFDELTEIISQDVGLSHKLLCAINQPANDLPVQVESIGEGLRYMGLKRLKFWVNLLMLSNMEDVPQELLTTSLINAKFCALMAQQGGHSSERDGFFLAGLFSNLDAYFKIPIREVVESLPLSDALNSALIDREGPVGEVLNILDMMHHQSSKAETLEFEGLDIMQISNNYLSASAWAQQAVMA